MAPAPDRASARPPVPEPLLPTATALQDLLRDVGNDTLFRVFTGRLLTPTVAEEESGRPAETVAGKPAAVPAAITATPATGSGAATPATAGAAATPAVTSAAAVVKATTEATRAAATPAAPSQSTAGPTLDEVVDELTSYLFFGLSEESGIVDRLRAEAERGRLREVEARYLQRRSITLRDAIIAASNRVTLDDRSPLFVEAMAILYGGVPGPDEPWAQMGLALLPPGTSDAAVLRLLTATRLAQRRKLKADYDRAFRGIGVTPHDTLEEHIAGDTSGYEKQRALALLDHELTDADHLSFVTTAIASADDEAALAILQRVRRRGVAGFERLEADWDRHVRQPGYTRFGLEGAMEDELDGVELDVARAIFSQYRAVKRGEYSFEYAAILVARATITSGLQAGIFTSRGDIVAAGASDLRKAIDAQNLKEGRRNESDLEGIRQAADAQLVSRRSLGGTDKIEARIQLRREPTFADRIYLASMRGRSEAAVQAVTEAWLANAEGDLESQLHNPPSGDPRPPLSVSETAIRAEPDAFAIYERLTDPRLTHLERGAVRLELALHGLGHATVAANLETAYRFLKGIKDRRLREQVIAAYVERYLNRTGEAAGKGTVREADEAFRPDNPQDRFYEAVQRAATGFEESPTLVDLLTLLRPVTNLTQASVVAERRDKATRTGRLNSLATTILQSVYDPISGERTLAFADAARRRLRRWAELERASPAELRAVIEATGVSDAAALANRGYDDFIASLNEVRSAKGTITAVVGGIVEFTSRSVGVALLGPAGLGGLLAAFGSFIAGIAAQEALAGAEYQAASAENLSKFVGEVGTFGFKALGIEQIIEQTFATGAFAGARGTIAARVLGEEGLSENNAKRISEFLNQAGAKVFEKVGNDMVENPSFPTAGEIAVRAAHAGVATTARGVATRLVDDPSIFASISERYVVNLKTTIVKGPPPNAAIGYAMAKALTDSLVAPDAGTTTLAEKLVRVGRAGVTSLASALPVAAAFTSLGEREAKVLRLQFVTDPEAFENRLRLARKNKPVYSAAP